VTSLLEPPTPTTQLVSDQWFYDALYDGCDPSYYLHNNDMSGGDTNSDEGPLVGTFLAAGQAVVTSDYEGENLAWTSAQQSGEQTLDGIRAALNYRTSNKNLLTGATTLSAGTKVGLIGYSGGAIATEWASELAATYAPDVSKLIVGTAIGGVYVYPYHNLKYVSGSPKWSGVIPGGLLGTARGFGIDSAKYASKYGTELATEASKVCINALLSKHPGLTYQQLVKPQYADFAKVPAFVAANNKSIMSTGGTPTAPMYIAQGVDPDPTGPQGEMTPPSPQYGAGDGVMLQRDTQSLAYTYCHRGVSVDYQLFTSGHTNTFLGYFPVANAFLKSLFNGAPAVSNCSTLAPGNSLAPLPMPKTATTTAHQTTHASHHSATHATTAASSSSNNDALADTGLEQTQRLLLWSALLLSLGAGMLWAARRPRPALIVAGPSRRRPLPGPVPAPNAGAPRRPLPHPRG
jgi:Secretory lipase